MNGCRSAHLEKSQPSKLASIGHGKLGAQLPLAPLGGVHKPISCGVLWV